jgi:hypothetical protein
MRSQLIVFIIFPYKTYKCKFIFNCKYIGIGANVTYLTYLDKQMLILSIGLTELQMDKKASFRVVWKVYGCKRRDNEKKRCSGKNKDIVLRSICEFFIEPPPDTQRR